ncbi:MAG: hypothetical protein ISR55_07900 [Bacteroidetes bacterium]|nr:hypothetical protein [Bacteroidota bacterium]
MKSLKKKIIIAGLLILIGSSAFLFSCRKDIFITNPEAKLAFSTDTVFFDTVFTTLGTATQRFLVYNPHAKSIKISSIELAEGKLSSYRINIDGEPATSLKDYALLPQDSIYIFVNVTIDPNSFQLPFIVKDSIVFQTNGNVQDVKLMTWGQNANFLRDSILECNTVWDSDLPYVISNHIGVDENCKLTIKPGVKIYSDNFSGIFVWGTLEVLGDTNNPVIFQGIRPEIYYQDIPGQWWGIHFIRESKDNVIRNAEIRNGMIGIRVDSLPINTNPNLLLENVKVENMSVVGIVGYTAHIIGFNCIVSNCCKYLVVGELGGNYEFYHSTFAHNSCQCYSHDPALSFFNTDNGSYLNDLNVVIANSIIWGPKEEETDFRKTGGGQSSISISNTMITTKHTEFNDFGNIMNKDPKFINPCNYNYELDSASLAINQGDPAITGLTPYLKYDFSGFERKDGKPDLGALEYKN